MARKNLLVMVGAAALVGPLAFAGTTASATGGGSGSSGKSGNTLYAELDPLNNSGVTGVARVKVKGNKHVRVDYRASGLLPGMPHAVHIHYGEEAAHECPTVTLDVNQDHRLNTAEGLPAYGPIAISLTTKGDTSPDSALDVDRFPTAPEGEIRYSRTVGASKDVAKAIKDGEGVLVIHGLDYNQNGMYDMDGAGASELDETLPAEATDPAACGVISQHHSH